MSSTIGQNFVAGEPAGHDRGLQRGLWRNPRSSASLHGGLAAAALCTELSPSYSQKIVDIGHEQILLEQSAAQAWFEQASRAHAGAVTHFQSVEGFVSLTMAARARVADVSVVPSIGVRGDEFWGSRARCCPFPIRPASARRAGRQAAPIWKDRGRSVEGRCGGGSRGDGGKAVLRQGRARRPPFSGGRRQGRFLPCDLGRVPEPMRPYSRNVEDRGAVRDHRQSHCCRKLRPSPASCSSWEPMAIGAGANGSSAGSPKRCSGPRRCRFSWRTSAGSVRHRESPRQARWPQQQADCGEPPPRLLQWLHSLRLA